MTIEEYRTELRRLSERFAEQNSQLHRASRLLDEHPDAPVCVDSALLAELDQVCEHPARAVTPPSAGVRC